VQLLTLDDYLAIASELLVADISALARVGNIGAAEGALRAPFAGYGDRELYPDPWRKLGVLGYRVARCDALPDGNKRMAFLVMLEFAYRNGIPWAPGDEAGPVIERAAAGVIDEDAFCAWVMSG
jgi:death-on-curing protein